MKQATPLPRHCGRTVLRRLTEADLACFQTYRSDPEVARFQSWEQMTDKEAMSFLREMNEADLLLPGCWCQIGIADRSEGSLIGDIGMCVSRDEKEAEIGFTLGRKYQKRGLGRESVREAIHLIFEQTSVDRVMGITDDRNLSSVRLLEAVGLTSVKTLDSVFRGEHCTELTYATCRPE